MPRNRFTRVAAAFGVALLPVSLLTLLPPAASAAPVVGEDVLYTLDADFDQGVLQNVNHDAPNNDQLQLDRSTVFFPYVNVAKSGRGTMVRIDVNTGEIIGEWLSAPDGRGRNPSRTTVDRLGNTWLSNRNEAQDVDGDGNGEGSVTRVGVISGGTRVDGDGTPNPGGDYLAPPFAYNTCIDRDLDGLIATSRGLDDVRPWTNAGGIDNDGGVETAADECLINYVRVAGTNTRTVAVDANNDVWTGGFDLEHQKISSATGLPAGAPVNFGCGGYGGLIDLAGTLWSARYPVGNTLLRYEPDTNTGACLDGTHGNYGLGMDPDTGEIWHTFLNGNLVAKLAPDGTVLGTFAHGFDRAQGVAVDGDGNVWVAHSLDVGTTVGHLRTDGTFVGNVTLPGGIGPTGVAVDSNGKVWVTNYNTHNAMRIDPDAGPIGGGGFPIGAVDLTVPLGEGALPYNYSDMTGSVLGEITAPIGTWSVVQDGGDAGQPWGTVTWNTEPQGSEPPGTSITVDARASDTEAGLAGEPFVTVGNGVPFALDGRFIEVRATLRASQSGDSPVLSDLRIETADRDGVFSCQATAVQIAGLVAVRANPPDVPCVDDHENLANVQLSAGVIAVRANALDARTDQTPDDLDSTRPAAGDNATATARIESTQVTSGLLVNIELGVIRSTASATCAVGAGGLQPTFAGSSHIASLRINGVPITVGSAPLTIPLVIGSLHLNNTVTTGTSVVQRAVFLDTLLTDVVLGEARANVEGTAQEPDGNPCEV